MLEIVCNGSICVCFVLTCIATNIKISTSWFDVNFYFVYFIAPIITSHIIYLATNIHNISLKVLSSYVLIFVAMLLGIMSVGMWRLSTRFVMMVIHNSSQT